MERLPDTLRGRDCFVYNGDIRADGAHRFIGSDEGSDSRRVPLRGHQSRQLLAAVLLSCGGLPYQRGACLGRGLRSRFDQGIQGTQGVTNITHNREQGNVRAPQIAHIRGHLKYSTAGRHGRAFGIQYGNQGFSAQCEYRIVVREQGGDAFREFSLPEALLKFRQGVGRLIRTGSDKGIIVILDNRVLTKPYGKAFLAVLPKCPVEVVE